MKRTLLTLAAASLMLGAALPAQAQKIGLAMANQDTFLSLMSGALLDHGKKVGAQVQMEVAQDDVANKIHASG